MRPLLLVPCILLVPVIAASGTQLDPLGDQETFVSASSFGFPQSLGNECEDAASDVIHLELVSLNETAEVRLTVAGSDDSRPVCRGQDVLVPISRLYVVRGETNDGRAIFLHADGKSSDDFAGGVCGAPTENGCWGSMARFHREGDVLVWTIDLVSEPHPDLDSPGFDLRGVPVAFSARASTSFPSGLFLGGLYSNVVSIRDVTENLSGTY